MSTRTGMAATFTPITLEEIERLLNRAFRAMTPRKGAMRGEVYFDLFLSSKVCVRVWSSVGAGNTGGAGVGEDAIRIQLYSTSGRPLKSGKAPIVKRTQGWRDNLQERVEDEIEDYHAREGYWEGRA